MIIIKRAQITYYVKDESIIAEYNNQFISYNVYSLQNRKRFKDFKHAVMESTPYEYGTIGDLMTLSTRFGLKGMIGRKPTISEFDTYL